MLELIANGQGSVSLQRLNGRRQLAADLWGKGIPGEVRLPMIKPTSLELGERTNGKGPLPWIALSQMAMACITWQAMYGSGAAIGMTKTTTLSLPEITQRGLSQVFTVFCAAARGAVRSISSCVSPFATTQISLLGHTTSVFAAPNP